MSFRSQNSLYNIPEFNRLIEELRTRNLEGKEAASVELKSVYVKYSEHHEMIFEKIRDLINKPDISFKIGSLTLCEDVFKTFVIGGLAAVDHLAPIIHETETFAFMNKFLSPVFQQFTIIEDVDALKRVAVVFGKLLRMGETKIAQIIEADIEEVFKWLQSDIVKQKRKLAAILALKQMLIEAPYVAYNKIFMNNKSFTLIWNIIRVKDLDLREVALDFVHISIQHMSQRELGLQTNWLSNIKSEVKKSRSSQDPDIIHGNICIYRSLLAFMPKGFIENMQDVGDYILSHKNSRYPYVQTAVIITIPYLAKYDLALFTKNYLSQSLQFLLDYGLNATRPDQKSMSYDTLANLMTLIESTLLEANVDGIVKTLLAELEKRFKPFCFNVIKCLDCIRLKLGKKLQEHIDVEKLCELILINGLYPQNINFLRDLCRLMEDTSDNNHVNIIQLKLLMTISSILSGQIYEFHRKSSNHKEKVARFRTDITTELEENDRFRNTESIALALQALASFHFTYYANSMAMFVRDFVLDYLNNSKPVIRKAAAEASSLLQVRKASTSIEANVTNNLAEDALEKFLSVCLSDPDTSVRVTMLASLNRNFDVYLYHQKYLKMLLGCLNDPNYKVQANSLRIVCRLIKYDPAEIVPYIKKKIFQSLSALTHQFIYNEEEKVEILGLLACMIEDAPELLSAQTDTLCVTMMSMLNDPRTSNNMIPHILTVFRKLSVAVKQDILPYLNDFFHILIQCMQDMSSSTKREVSIKTITQLIKSVGYVILPYYKSPNLLDTILFLLKTETIPEIRMYLLRLMGSLGALDAFYYKKIQLRLAESQDPSSLQEILQQDFKYSFAIYRKIQDASIVRNQSKTDLIKFYSDLLTTNDLDKKKKVGGPKRDFKTQALLDGQLKLEERNYSNQYMQKSHLANPEVEELLYSYTPIHLSNPDYHTRVTIKALLKILCDPTLNQHHYLVVEALISILNTLKSRFAYFLDLVVPVFIHLINQNVNLREILFHHLESMIYLCDTNYPGQLVQPVLELALAYVTNPEGKLMVKCFELLLTLIKSSKQYLRHQMELITTKLNQIMSTFDDAKDVVKNVLYIYTELGEMLDIYLEHIIALLTKISRNYALSDTASVESIIQFYNVCITECPSTKQQLPIMIHSLVFILDYSPLLHQPIVNCFVNMIYHYRDDFLMYFPLVNSYVSKHKIPNEAYQKCLDFLITHDSLEEIDGILEDEDIAGREKDDSDEEDSESEDARDYTVNEYLAQPMPVRASDMNILLEEFQTFQKDFEKDWIEWLRRSSLELLKQNPSPILFSCYPVAELYLPLARELYNVAFVACWCMLTDKQKETMVNLLNKAIKHSKAPVHLLQTILNLAEFMEHDREVIPIDIVQLGISAEKCHAYAKALYYRELQFEISPEWSIESLVNLYVNLGQTEAANGIMIYAKNTSNIELKTIWYEALGKWEEALEAYNAEEAKTDEDYFVNKMRCLHAMSDWELIMKNCDPLIEEENVENIDKRKQVIQLAANAALNLNEWGKLEKYTENMKDDYSEDAYFFQAIVNLKKNRYDQAISSIHRSRDVLDSKVSGLLLESYSRAYTDVIKLQQLVELEEIIEFKKEESRLLMEAEELKEVALESESKIKARIEELYQNNQVSSIKTIKLLKSQLIEKWNDRLNGCEPSFDVWQRVLAVRSTLLSRYENLDAWLRFCKMCMKEDQIEICQRALESIRKDFAKINIKEENLPPRIVLMSMQCDYLRNAINLNQFVENVSKYLETKSEANDLKSRYYLKIGNYLKKNKENMSEESIELILSYYEKSTNCDRENYQAWHYLGLMNFEAVEYFQNQNEKADRNILIPYITASLRGFGKAVSLGASNLASSKSFQDILRFLTLCFNYGDLPSVKTTIYHSVRSINITSWIEAVPQLIARFDTPNKTVRDLVHMLLKYIGHNHPQALLYSLTVALKEKQSGRKEAATKILDDMKQNYKELIDQAIIISDELCRTAITLKEQWSDAIREATQFYQKRDFQTMLRILMPYHEAMRKAPETLSETAFHQAFKYELGEAESWLSRFINTQDEYCVNHAFDLYYSVFKKIQEKLSSLTTVSLANVAPKLLNIKNTSLSVPGLYAPNKPLIKISSFAAELDVLASKQRPRKLIIFGSDGKEYTFLLKGHEDTRQDERVMQLFSLLNRIMSAETETKKKDLTITTYSVIPLSTRVGLIGWVHNSDPLQKLIREYRESFNIVQNAEMRLLNQVCPNFTQLSLANKLEAFRNMFDKTKGEDLKKVLWLKSPSSEIWLERRTSYTRSLATMSMVGYILGLGDRHPSNIMLQRRTGKIVHIDFGDCFEVAMKREEVPEKVPFRLTRMLIKVMEACSIEGTYRATCEDVMQVLRDNKDSLIAVLQVFVYDPLVNWRLLTPSDAKQETGGEARALDNIVIKSGGAAIQRVPSEKTTGRKMTVMMDSAVVERNLLKKKTDLITGLEEGPDMLIKEDIRQRELKAQLQEEENRPAEILNHRAVEVVDRIKKKLTGRDFKENEVLDVVGQVDKLVRQASSTENICQSFIGWCPFW